MTEGSDEFWTHCARCGDQLGLADWPPVVDAISDGDETIVRSFCDEDCLSEWRAND